MECGASAVISIISQRVLHGAYIDQEAGVPCQAALCQLPNFTLIVFYYSLLTCNHLQLARVRVEAELEEKVV